MITNSLLENKLSKFGDSLNKEMIWNKNKLNELRIQINKIKKNVQEIDESQKFLSETQKEKIKELTRYYQKIHKENKSFNGQLNDLRHSLQENQNRTNQLAQYHQSSYMVGLAGICKTRNKTGIIHFDVGQIDVVHGTSLKKSTPTNILFIKKSDRMNFYYQKKSFLYLIQKFL